MREREKVQKEVNIYVCMYLNLVAACLKACERNVVYL